MQVKLAGFGILSLFLIMLVPVYGEVTEFSIEKNFYTNDEGVVFVGTEDEGRKLVSVLMTDPKGKESMLVSAMSNSDGVFQTAPKNVDDLFSIIGTYQFTAFTIQKDNGEIISLKFDGNKVLEPTKYVLQLNSIQDKIIEVEKTVTFIVSITDNSITNVVYNLENAPVSATIDSTSGKFVWTPSKSYGSYEDVIYNFDIIVNVEDKEDRENISITVKKAYDEPEIEPKVEVEIEPKVEVEIEPKVEVEIEPKVEVEIEPKVEVEIGLCGDGTKLINGVCTIVEKIIEKPWWQFW